MAISPKYGRWSVERLKTAAAGFSSVSFVGVDGVTATPMHMEMQQLFTGALSWSPDCDGGDWQCPDSIICA